MARTEPRACWTRLCWAGVVTIATDEGVEGYSFLGTSNQGADEFLGTQGDPWDTQSDMLCALIGAASALALFTRMQDRQIDKLR